MPASATRIVEPREAATTHIRRLAMGRTISASVLDRLRSLVGLRTGQHHFDVSIGRHGLVYLLQPFATAVAWNATR